MMEYASLINDNLVPSYNRQMPRLMAFLHMVMQPLEDIRCLVGGDGFNLDTAVGKQLDVLGSLAGVSRVLPFKPAYDSRTLDDENYRMLIRAKIARNVWGGTNAQAMEMFSGLFPQLGLVLIDHQRDESLTPVVCHVTIRITSVNALTPLVLEMIAAGLLIPVPAGVYLTYEIPATVEIAGITIQSGIYTTGELELALHETSAE